MNEPRRLLIVDAARGLAAAVVFIHHLDVFYPKAFESLLGDSIGHRIFKSLSSLNVEAVMLFFIISGFCIRETSRKYNFGQLNDLSRYGRRRVARIVPLYLIALAFTYITGIAMGENSDSSYSGVTLVGNLIFLQSPAESRGVWFVPYGGNGPLWSISFEVFYYAFFPVALLLEERVSERFQTWAPLTGMIAAYVLSFVALIFYQVAPNPILLFLTLYSVWRVGVCADDLRQENASSAKAIAALTALAILIGAGVLAWGSDTARVILSGTVLGIVWLAFQSYPSLSQFGDAAPLRWIINVFAALGAISYGLYLIHYPMLKLTHFLFTDSFVGLIIGIGASLVLAALVEALGGHLKRQLLLSRAVRVA